MRPVSIDSPDFIRPVAKPAGLDNLARRIVRSRLENIESGQLVISENGEHVTYGRVTEETSLTARLCIENPRFYRDVAFGGAIGAGEAFMQGDWSCTDLTAMLRILLQNRDVLQKVDSGVARLTRPVQKMIHFFNKNTQKGSRRNIAAHYDLGNDFYSLWLDPSMMYSCAYFDSPNATLAEASTAKLDRICRKLNLSPGDSVIEIGTGWGGFAIHAAGQYGCHVTTTTISKQQHEFAERAVRDAGLEDRVTLLFDDYRDLDGQFDKLVSIEMIEAVGHEFHATFFRRCCELLKPDGQMLLQAITIADQQYDRYKTDVDFIKRYIFPGGCLTSVTDMSRTMTRHTDMRVIHLEDIGPHYATTLRCWHDCFIERIEEVRALGYSEAFIRMWQYYLCYCESAFLERATGTVQMLIMRPDVRCDSIRY